MMAEKLMEDLCDVCLELVRDILDLAENIEEGATESEHLVGKAEEFFLFLYISVLSKVDKLQ